MARAKLELTITHLQARARGYLMRNEVRRAQEDYEDVVREIDGSLGHLQWVKKVLYFPHFTDTQGAIPRPSSPASNLQTPDPSGLCRSPSSADRSIEDRGVNHSIFSENLEAERDVPQTKGHTSESADCVDDNLRRANRETQNEGGVTEKQKDGALMESACDSTTVWSSLDTDVDCSRPIKGLRQYYLARDVPRTPKALRLHRNTLSMELLWLQQAIDSRKKYLSLKNKLYPEDS